MITPDEASRYVAGCIIPAAARCAAMVFETSPLPGGDPADTVVQFSANDFLMLSQFAPNVRYLVTGASSLELPF